MEGGQLPGGGPQTPAKLLGAAKAQVIGHGEDFLPAQHPGGVDEVAVAGVGQSALQVQLPVGRAVHTVELQPPGVEGAHAGEGQLPQALLQQGGRHRHLEHRARRVGGKGPVHQGGILPLGGLAQIQGGEVRHAGHRPDFAPRRLGDHHGPFAQLLGGLLGQPLDGAVQGEGHPGGALLQGVHHLGLLPGQDAAHGVHPVGDGNLPAALA